MRLRSEMGSGFLFEMMDSVAANNDDLPLLVDDDVSSDDSTCEEVGDESDSSLTLKKKTPLHDFERPAGDGSRGSIRECDACPYCEVDGGAPTCALSDTVSTSHYGNNTSRTPKCCNNKHNNVERFFTPCQIRRHNTRSSAWIIVGSVVYDATSYLKHHPGGIQSILKKSGYAADCTEDMAFHSHRARKLLKRFRIGVVKPCPGDGICTQFEGRSNMDEGPGDCFIS